MGLGIRAATFVISFIEFTELTRFSLPESGGTLKTRLSMRVMRKGCGCMRSLIKLIRGGLFFFLFCFVFGGRGGGYSMSPNWLPPTLS